MTATLNASTKVGQPVAWLVGVVHADTSGRWWLDGRHLCVEVAPAVSIHVSIHVHTCISTYIHAQVSRHTHSCSLRGCTRERLSPCRASRRILIRPERGRHRKEDGGRRNLPRLLHTGAVPRGGRRGLLGSNGAKHWRATSSSSSCPCWSTPHLTVPFLWPPRHETPTAARTPPPHTPPPARYHPPHPCGAPPLPRCTTRLCWAQRRRPSAARPTCACSARAWRWGSCC